MGMAYELVDEIGWFFGIYFLICGLSVAFSVLIWVLRALGLYTIANRRGIKHPWMAWVPVTDMWILGSISDQYQYVARGKVKNRRKWLVGLMIALTVVMLIFFAVWISAVTNVILSMDELYMNPSEAYVEELLLRVLTPMLGVVLLMYVVAWWQQILQWMCYYNLFASSDPDNKTVYTVVGILINVTMPFFVFACRNKDLGMPPRKPVTQEIPVKVVEAEVEEPINGPVNENPVEE